MLSLHLNRRMGLLKKDITQREQPLKRREMIRKRKFALR